MDPYLILIWLFRSPADRCFCHKPLHVDIIYFKEPVDLSYEDPKIWPNANGLGQPSMVRFTAIVGSQRCLVNRETFHSNGVEPKFLPIFLEFGFQTLV